MTLGTILVELGVDTRPLVSGMQTGERSLQNFGSSAQQVAQRVGSSMGQVERLTLRAGGAVDTAAGDVRQALASIQAASEQTTNSLGKMAAAGQRLQPPIRAVGGASSNAQQAMMQLGYALNDAQQFSYGASAGIRSISNNLVPVIGLLGGGAGAVALFSAAATAAAIFGDKLFDSGKKAKTAAGEYKEAIDEVLRFEQIRGVEIPVERIPEAIGTLEQAVRKNEELVRLYREQARPLQETKAAISNIVAAGARGEAVDRKRLQALREEKATLEAALEPRRAAAEAAQEQLKNDQTLVAALQQQLDKQGKQVPAVERLRQLGFELDGIEKDRLTNQRNLIDAIRKQIREIERLNRASRGGEIKPRPPQPGILRDGEVRPGALDRIQTPLGTEELRAFSVALRDAGMSAEEAARLQDRFQRESEESASAARFAASVIGNVFRNEAVAGVERFADFVRTTVMELGTAQRAYAAAQVELTRWQIEEEIKELEAGFNRKKISQARYNQEIAGLKSRLASGEITQDEYAAEEAALKASLNARAISRQEYTIRMKALTAELAIVEQEAALQTGSLIEQVFHNLKDTVSQTLRSIVAEITAAIAKAALLKGILALTMPGTKFSFANLLLGSLGFRAEGGPVEPGKPYVVGERGAELIMPSRPGFVLPADVTKELLSGRSASQTAAAAVAPLRPALPRSAAQDSLPASRALSAPTLARKQTAADFMPAAASYASTMGGPPAAFRERDQGRIIQAGPTIIRNELRIAPRIGMGELWFELEEYKAEQGIR